jgi:hypothetical protein
MDTKKKPDQVADNPGLLPYASNVGAPVIRPDDVAGWKIEQTIKTNQYFSAKYEEIKEEYRKLIEQYEWSELVYKSKYNFIPSKGQIYFLYQSSKEGLFLSLIEPYNWNQVFIGAFKLDTDDKWIKVDGY